MIYILAGIIILAMVAAIAAIAKSAGKQEAFNEVSTKESTILKKQNDIAAGPADSPYDTCEWLQHDDK